MVTWPTTPEGWCELYRQLDEKYNTAPNTPLHHDGRCPIHLEKK